MNHVLAIYFGRAAAQDPAIGVPVGTPQALLIYLRQDRGTALDVARALLVAEEEGWGQVEIDEAAFAKEDLDLSGRPELQDALSHGHHIVHFRLDE